MDERSENKFKKNLERLKNDLEKVQEEMMKEQLEKSKLKDNTGKKQKDKIVEKEKEKSG